MIFEKTNNWVKCNKIALWVKLWVTVIFNKEKTHISYADTWVLSGGERGIWTLAPVTRPTPLAGAPLRPLEYFSRAKSFGNDSLLMAERVGFEPTARCRVTGFQDRLLKPLGHLSTFINKSAPKNMGRFGWRRSRDLNPSPAQHRLLP